MVGEGTANGGGIPQLVSLHAENSAARLLAVMGAVDLKTIESCQYRPAADNKEETVEARPEHKKQETADQVNQPEYPKDHEQRDLLEVSFDDQYRHEQNRSHNCIAAPCHSTSQSFGQCPLQYRIECYQGDPGANTGKCQGVFNSVKRAGNRADE